MAITFHKLKVADVRRETDDAVSVAFEIPAALQEAFRFKPGQYLTVRPHLQQDDARRSYSLCSCATNGEAPTITVKRVDGGLVSNYINNHLKAGDEMDVMPPLGNFVAELQAYHARHYVLIGAGSGITPLMSIIKSVLKDEPSSRVTLLYGNRRRDTIIFYDELQDLQAEFGERLRIVHVLSRPDAAWQGLSGRLDKQRSGELLRELMSEREMLNCHYYLCGPSAMMEATQEALAAAGIDQDRIYREYFTTPLAGSGQVDVSAEEDETAVASESALDFKEAEVTVLLYGIENRLSVKPEETILDVAVREDVDPPFACQIGACCTCRAKLISGTVEMDEREALTDEEVAEGYILTCQSHPRSAKIVVDYDQ